MQASEENIKKFKVSNGNWRTNNLFIERSEQGEFTEKDYDFTKNGITYPSLKRIYMSYDQDPTDYQFACEVLGGWDHWKTLTEGSTTKDLIAGWKEEKEIMMRSAGVSAIVKQAVENDSYQAAKYLADKGWEDKPMGARSKKAKEKETQQQRHLKAVAGSDLKRLRS